MPRLARCQKLASVQANCKSLGASLVPGCCLVQATLPSSAWNLNELPLLSVRLTLDSWRQQRDDGARADARLMPARSRKHPEHADRQSRLGRVAPQPSASPLSREAAKLVVPHRSTKAYSMTAVTRGAATTSFTELKAVPRLRLSPKPPSGMAESLAYWLRDTRQAR